MRFILTILIWVIIVGGLWSYSKKRMEAEANIVRRVPEIAQVEEMYSLRVTPTFSIEPDPFALQTDDSASAGIELRLNGTEIRIESDSMQRGKAWVLEKVDGLAVGNNEIYVQASPPIAESDLEHGVRVQLVKAGVAAVDDTIWGQGGLVSGTIHFELETKDEKHDH